MAIYLGQNRVDMYGGQPIILEGVDTSDATAAARDIVKDKTAYVNGSKITGTMNRMYGNYANEVYIDEEGDLMLRTNVGTKSFIEDSFGIYTSATNMGDATASDVAEGKTFTSAEGVQIEGTLPTYSSGKLSSDSIAYNSMTAQTTGDLTIGIDFNNSDYLFRNGSGIYVDVPLSEFGDATASDVAVGKTFTSTNGLKITGTKTESDSNIADFTYEVNNISGADYDFELNSNGYYESQNKGVNTSYAICRVNFVVSKTCNITFDVINYAESNYDYALFSNLDTTLALSNTADSSVKKSFKGEQSASIVNVVYSNVSIGTHFIDIKFIKDSSQSQNNDSVQFKIQTPINETVLNEIYAIEPDLIASNIKSGIEILGVNGTYVGSESNGGIDTSDATAVATDIRYGKSAYVNGELISGSLHEATSWSVGESVPSINSAGNFVLTKNGDDTASDRIVNGTTNFTAHCSASLLGDATAADVAQGKTFTSVNGLKITGTGTIGGSGNNSIPYIDVDALYGSDDPYRDDSNGYICYTFSPNAQFIVGGDYPLTLGCAGYLFGDASASDVAAGKTFTSSAGLKVTGTATLGGSSSGATSGSIVKAYQSSNVTIGSGYTNISITYGTGVSASGGTISLTGSSTLNNVSSVDSLSVLKGKYVSVSTYGASSGTIYYIPTDATFTQGGSTYSKTFTVDKCNQMFVLA